MEYGSLLFSIIIPQTEHLKCQEPFPHEMAHWSNCGLTQPSLCKTHTVHARAWGF